MRPEKRKPSRKAEILHPAHPGRGSLQVEIGHRLRTLRKQQLLGLLDVAADSGVHYSRLSRLERGVDVIRRQEAAAILGALNVDSAEADRVIGMCEQLTIEPPVSWDLPLGGVVQRIDDAQQHVAQAIQRTQHFRNFDPLVVPGFLHTDTYALRIFETQRTLDPWSQVEDDESIASARRTRTEWQRTLQDPFRRFEFILLEQALTGWIWDAQEMLMQIRRIMVLSLQENIHIGLIPAGTPLPLVPLSSFYIYDHDFVTFETSAAAFGTSAGTAVQAHIQMFDKLRGVAVHGDTLREALQMIASRLADDVVDLRGSNPTSTQRSEPVTPTG